MFMVWSSGTQAAYDIPVIWILSAGAQPFTIYHVLALHKINLQSKH